VLRRYLLAVTLCVAVVAAYATASTAAAETYPGGYWPYSRIGPYLDSVPLKKNPVAKWPGVVMNKEAGLPEVLKERTPYWNTVLVATYGLEEFNIYYFHHKKAHLGRAIRAANWLVGWQEAGGGWPYLISFTYPDGQQISPPWLACQAQGQAISLLVRVYELTGQSQYLRSAQLGMDALTHLTVNVKGHELLEGFPTAKPSVTLEDLQLALIGLYDLSYLDESAAGAFAHYSAEFFSALSLWDGSRGPWYDLTYLNGTPPIYVAGSAAYDGDLLGLLAEATGSPEARAMAEKWQDEEPPPSGAAAYGAPELLYFDAPLWPRG
jgi:D-glucuronyl C5-epimerase C-terminus